MSVLFISEKQLGDLSQLVGLALADMAAHEKEGDLEQDGYTDEDRAARKLLAASGEELMGTIREAYANEKEARNNQYSQAQQSTNLARMVLMAYSHQAGIGNEEPAESSAFRDLLADLRHFADKNDIDYDAEFDAAINHFEEEADEEANMVHS